MLTSRDSTVFTHDAFYQYYLHGPLARTVLGEHQVQGMDYAYTIQGWLKMINSSLLSNTREMGKDGTGSYTARDAYAFALGYFNNDYKPVNDALTTFNSPEALNSSLNQVNLYNGNIAHTVVDLKALGGDPMARTYQYDQLNRLLKANTATNGIPNIDNWSFTNDYYEQLSYDPNGNIITNKRPSWRKFTPNDWRKRPLVPYCSKQQNSVLLFIMGQKSVGT